MPAAAVIPAPLAYIKVVAVKKLVVEFLASSIGVHPLKVQVGLQFGLSNCPPCGWLSLSTRNSLFRHLIKCEAGWYILVIYSSMFQQFYLEKIRVLTAGSWGVKTSLCLNNVAWDNRIWPRFYSVGLIEQQIS